MYTCPLWLPHPTSPAKLGKFFQFATASGGMDILHYAAGITDPYAKGRFVDGVVYRYRDWYVEYLPLYHNYLSFCLLSPQKGTALVAVSRAVKWKVRSWKIQLETDIHWISGMSWAYQEGFPNVALLDTVLLERSFLISFARHWWPTKQENFHTSTRATLLQYIICLLNARLVIKHQFIQLFNTKNPH